MQSDKICTVHKVNALHTVAQRQKLHFRLVHISLDVSAQGAAPYAG